ncbi:hypothetical protein HUJ05_001893 [Dendroctonus ponderosae]|nr:hypothetical protein HUJ05_001893 [Dendroctonus ponderosae]
MFKALREIKFSDVEVTAYGRVNMHVGPHGSLYTKMACDMNDFVLSCVRTINGQRLENAVCKETTALKTYIGISSSIIHDMFKNKLKSGVSSSSIGSPGGTVMNCEFTKKLNAKSNIKIGHMKRNDSRFHLLHTILQGKVMGKRGVGRRRISWLKNLRSWFGLNTTELFRAAANRRALSRNISVRPNLNENSQKKMTNFRECMLPVSIPIRSFTAYEEGNAKLHC